jgi:hypothetical protein
VSLSSLRGNALLRSLINPACQIISCPAIGPEFRQAIYLIGSAGHVRQQSGTGTAAADFSFAVLFADAARQPMDDA